MDDRLTRSLKKTHLVLKSPPPWTLRGEGIILLFKFSKEWIDACSHISDALKKRFRGGLGYVMMVDYHESPVGPYRELLIIPGKFRKNRKHVISRIVVDSEASTINGRANWGIPKETFPIDWKKEKAKILSRSNQKKRSFFRRRLPTGNSLSGEYFYFADFTLSKMEQSQISH